MPEPHRGVHDTYISNYINTGVAKVIGFDRELMAVRKDGSLFPIQIAINPMLVEGQRAFVASLHDITERRRIEQLKNEFISMVSHELRTPLTSIHGALGLVLSSIGGTIDEKARDLIDVAYRNSDRLTLLINDILDLEKMASGKIKFDLRPENIAEVVSLAVTLNIPYAEKHKVTFVVAQPPSSAKVMVDKDRFLQVMANLLSNAAKFSHPEGVVEISAIETDGRVRISVTDHGSGIPPEFEKRVFEKFAQANKSPDSPAKGGTGLGLNISKQIVENMNGTIGFSTKVGEGTTFYFELPLAKPEDINKYENNMA